MAWIYKVTNAFGSMTEEEKTNNAILQYQQLRDVMTVNAICGLLGNEEWESYINPGQWQGSYNVGDMDGGYGLVMWTPASKIYNTFSDPYNGVEQTQAILELRSNDWIPTAAYPQSFEEFKASAAEPETTAAIFCFNYERAGDVHLLERQQYARKWYNYFSENPPGPGPGPGPEPGEHKKMSIIFYLRRRLYK